MMKNITTFLIVLFYLTANIINAQEIGDSLGADGFKNDTTIIIKTDSLIINTDIVWSAKRKWETKLITPVSVEKISYLDLQNAPSFLFYEEIRKLRGIDITHSGVLTQSINASGFSDPLNTRFLELYDGMDLQFPEMGFTLGNTGGIPQLDVESIEVIPLSSSALYGPHAMNGVLNIKSKDPFLFEGLSVKSQVGINNIQTRDSHFAEPIFEIQSRYAKIIHDRIAIKANLSIFQTQDWQPSELNNQRLGSNGEGSTITDHGFDGVNFYGDEFSTLFPFGPKGSDEDVARTGYFESDLFDYEASNFMGNGELHFKILPDLRFIVHGSVSNTTTVFSGVNRVKLNDVAQSRIKVALKGKHYHARFYRTWQNIGASYDPKLLGRNLNLFAKPNTAWFLDYAAAFGGGLVDQGVPAGDPQAARAFADGPGLDVFGNFNARLDPDDPRFESVKNSIINNELNFLGPVDSEFNSTSQGISHFEGFIDLEPYLKLAGVQLGVSTRMYDIDESNPSFSTNNFIDSYEEFSIYGQITKSLFSSALNITGNIRLDDSELYEGRTSFRGAVSYKLSDQHVFRASYNEGYRFPSIMEQFIDKDIGMGNLRGGFNDLEFFFVPPQGSPVLPLAGNTVFLNNVNEFDLKLREAVANGTPKNDAIQQFIDILGDGIVQPGQLHDLFPEERYVLEAGYRGKISNPFSYDISYFYSQTENLIGNVGVVLPLGVSSPVVDTTGAADALRDDRTRQILFFKQNSREKIISQGVRVGLQYIFSRDFIFSANGEWNHVDINQNDLVRVAYNAPDLKANFSLEKKNLWEELAVRITGRYQDDFRWVSAEGEGIISSFTTFDARVSYPLKHLNAMVSIGGQNIFGTGFEDNISGPTVGSIYYFSIFLDDIL